MESPSRSGSAGRQGLEDTNCREENPYKVVWHNESTPPTIAASQNPDCINREASANTLALEEHAVETTNAGPSSLKYFFTKAATEKLFWVSLYL